MAQLKGKFIILAGHLMTFYKEQQKVADDLLFQRIGKHFKELDPNGWYDVERYNDFMQKYAEASLTGKEAILTLGRQTFPLIKRTQGFPPHIKTVLDLIKFSVEQFLDDHFR